MCGRYYIEEDDPALQKILAAIAQDCKQAYKTGEVFPSDTVPALAARPCLMRWGFPKVGKGLIINARAETAAQKPMFAQALYKRRCLLPASKYFEWKKEGSKKIKHAFTLPGQAVIYLAGIYVETQGALPAFVILTREAPPHLWAVHDRMPLILPDGAREEWLKPGSDPEKIMRLAVSGLCFEPVGT